MTKAHLLPVYEQNLLHDLSSALPRWTRVPSDRRATAALCARFRQAGIASLLRTASSTTFRLRLQRSARAYLVHLHATRPEDQRRSKALPFFDALAVGDLASARQITAQVTERWAKDVESEESYLAVHAPMRLLEGDDDASLEALAARWEAALMGDVEPRHEVFCALIVRDASRSRDALESFLRARRAELSDESAHAPEAWATEVVISVEALAWLRLAELRGVEVDDDLRGAPRIARDDQPLPWADDSYLLTD